MKTVKTLIAALLCFSAITSYAQSTQIKPLTIGDKMPDLSLRPTINFAKPVFKTGDYNSRLLILDFWATWCHYCIEAFPKEDSLSVKFGKKLQFLLVDAKTDDPEIKVQNFYKKRLNADKAFNLPTIYSDTLLVKLFPHRLMPHYVWIRNGVIVAITDAEQITTANIQAVLDGKRVDMSVKSM